MQQKKRNVQLINWNVISYYFNEDTSRRDRLCWATSLFFSSSDDLRIRTCKGQKSKQHHYVKLADGRWISSRSDALLHLGTCPSFVNGKNYLSGRTTLRYEGLAQTVRSCSGTYKDVFHFISFEKTLGVDERLFMT